MKKLKRHTLIIKHSKTAIPKSQTKSEGVFYCMSFSIRLQLGRQWPLVYPVQIEFAALTFHQKQQSLQISNDFYVKFRSFLLIDFINSLEKKKRLCDLTYAFTDREIWPDNVITVDKQYISNVKVVRWNIYTAKLLLCWVILQGQSIMHINFVYSFVSISQEKFQKQ